MLKIYGGQSINAWTVRSLIEDSTTVDARSSIDTNWLWDFNTTAMCKYNNTINAGNLTDISESLTSWKIYRLNVTNGDTQYQLVCQTTDVTMTNIRDYMCANGNTYKFQIVGISDNYISESIYTQEVTANYHYWSLTDIYTKEVWLFQLNYEGNNIESNYTVNSNVNITLTNSRYPIFNIGEQRYLSNTISALIGNVDLATGEYSNDTIKIRNSLVDFLNNGNEKIFKNVRGDILQVQTYTNDFSINNNPIEKPQTINFNIIEVGSIDDLQVYDEVI